MNWYFDTSVLVAAAVRAHPHNAPALSVLEQLVKSRHRGYLSAHGITELYSVLTRAPFKPPIYPAEAFRIVENQVLEHLSLVCLDEKEYTDVVKKAAEAGLTGGRIHDAVHLQCARKMRCDRVYTFNLADFRTIAPTDMADRISLP